MSEFFRKLHIIRYGSKDPKMQKGAPSIAHKIPKRATCGTNYNI